MQVNRSFKNELKKGYIYIEAGQKLLNRYRENVAKRASDNKVV